jgi:hypothetical protein
MRAFAMKGSSNAAYFMEKEWYNILKGDRL